MAKEETTTGQLVGNGPAQPIGIVTREDYAQIMREQTVGVASVLEPPCLCSSGAGCPAHTDPEWRETR